MKLIDKLFQGGHSRSMTAFPLRLVYMKYVREGACPPAQMLVSVPKRCFKRAVKRNRVKRQIREAYRHHKHILWEAVETKGEIPSTNDAKRKIGVALAFIWLDDKLYDSAVVEQRVKALLERLAEKLKVMNNEIIINE
jgi:ribonuclease P protein component